MNDDEKLRQRVKVSSAFSPSAPIDSRALFAGRREQVNRTISAVFQRGQHVVLFGERGVGKTSLANTLYDLLQEVLGQSDFRLARFNCSVGIKFPDLWRGILR